MKRNPRDKDSGWDISLLARRLESVARYSSRNRRLSDFPQLSKPWA